MSEQKKSTFRRQKKLTKKQARYLRGLGHHLTATVHIGKDGITKTLVEATNEVLQARELIKVKLQNTCPLDRMEASELLSQKTGAAVAQILGKTILLFRENFTRNDEGKIRFP